MTRQQIARAARLYALALVANGDAHGAATDTEAIVMMEAIRTARRELARKGFDWGKLSTIGACIAAATTTTSTTP